MRKQDFDRHVASKEVQKRGNGIKYALVAIVSALATLGLVTCGFFFYRLFESRQAIAPSNNQNNSGNNTQVSTANTNIQPGQFVQPALGNKAQVELTAVRRIPGVPDEVSVEMKIHRLTNDATGSDVINVGGTTARNPIVSETYRGVDFLKRSSGTVSLFQMRRGEPVEGYVVLKVPQGVNSIDIYVNETQPFKNVPIAPPDQVTSGANNNAPPASDTSPTQDTAAVSEAPQTTTSAPPALNGNNNIQPVQMLQPAFGNKAQVELLSVKRIKDPEFGTRDVVNVQVRVRRIAIDGVSGLNNISISQTTARNPETSETYKSVGYERSTGNIGLYSMRPRSSADAYVWLRVPEGVNIIDIYIPDTQAFKNVPIAN